MNDPGIVCLYLATVPERVVLLPMLCVQVDLPGSWGDVASMINAPEPSARHQPRQKPTITKTQ